MQRRLVLLIVCTTVVLAVFPAVGSATFIPGPNGKIAFTSARPSTGVPAPNTGDKGARIYVADWPSGTPVQVTTLPAGAEVRHRQPNWSPDHTRIAYAAGASSGTSYALWILDLRTGSQTEIVPAAEGLDRPSWSPDGTKIAYGSKGDLWLTGPAPGSEQVQLTNTATITEERPVWSPDGNTLYYNQKEAAGTKDLYKKSPVTPAGAPVYDDPAKDAWQAAVSPDGGRLCFLLGPQSSASDLFTIPIDGSGGPAKFAEEGPATGELNCVWSPDGKLILYTRGAFEAGELYTRAPNGSGIDALSQYNVEGHFDGNADWATNFSPTCVTKNAGVGVNGFVSILLSCTDPDSGFGIEPPTPEPLGDSSMEIAAQPKNGTLGSLENGKVIYTPKKDFKGTDSFTYTGEDNVSTSKPATVTIQVGNPSGGGDATPPSISNIAVSPAKWRLGAKPANISDLALISKAPIGTTISFTLSEAAQATLSFQRAAPGRRVGRSCVKQTGRNAAKKRCTRYLNAGALAALAAKAGQNKVRFQGRLTGSRSLRLGRYRVVVKARDAAGNQSQPRTGPSFTIVKK
jgi:Tol biopolymer transport system component